MAGAAVDVRLAVTLADLLFDPPEWAADDDVLVHLDERTVTRSELTEMATRVRDTLQEAGVEPGMPVAVMLANAPETIATLFGVWAAHGVYVPLNPRLADDEVASLLEAVPCAAAVTTEEHGARFAAFGLPTLVLESGGGVVRPPRSTKRNNNRRGNGRGKRNGNGASAYPEDVALVQTTSGTTGPPKPVLLTHTGVLSLLDGVLEKVRGGTATKRSSTANLLPVSLSVWAGIYNVLFAFRVGAPVVLMDRFEPREFATLVARHGIRSVVLPPAAISMLCDDDEIDSLAPLEWVRSITAPLSPFLVRRFHDKFGVGVLNCYGQTEIGGEIIGWTAQDWREWSGTKLGAVGRPHTGVEIRAIDEDGSDLGSDTTGELVVRTPALSAGYADGSALGEDRMTPDGWFRTGDLGRVDADGFVWVHGRVSEQINRGGMKVTPSEVEEVLRAVPGVREVAVVGARDRRLGEVPVAFVVPDDASAPPNQGALEQQCRVHLSPWKVPVRFEVLDTLPRNEVGKVLKRELVERADA